MKWIESRRALRSALLCGTAWFVGTLTIGTFAPAFAGAPPAITLAALARQEGWNPDEGAPLNMWHTIPRDFPVPATSHHLTASNGFPAASVTGTPEQAEAFYTHVLPAQGWRIKRQVKFPGKFVLVACKTSQCVNLNCSSSQIDQSNPNLIRLLFFTE